MVWGYGDGMIKRISIQGEQSHHQCRGHDFELDCHLNTGANMIGDR